MRASEPRRDFTARLEDALRSEPSAILFDDKDRDYSRGEVAALADRAVQMLCEAGVPTGARVGVIVRNRALHAAAMLGLIVHERALTTVYSLQTPEAIAAEIRETRFAAVIADAQDWTQPVRDAVAGIGAAALVLDHGTPDIVFLDGLESARDGHFPTREDEPGLEILSSGTTGKPKRIALPFRMLDRAVDSVVAGRAGLVTEPDILTWPYGGIGGMCNLVAGVMLGRRTTILDRFDVGDWVAAIRRHRPTSLSGPPAIARMALDAGVAREDLASVRYFFGGGAAFPPDLQAEFEDAFGIKVIWAYGATEFCGTIISWTPALYETHRETKRGAIGVPLPGIDVRVVDPDTGVPLAPGRTGYLEAIVPAVGENWIRTTDLATIDEDGFVYHRGRGDGAIVRGGFKVLPEKIVEALLRHPAVLDAAVVGLPDRRLGAVPAAAVELRTDAAVPTGEELRAFSRAVLVAHHVPVVVHIVDALPRTTSLKPDLAAVRRLLSDRMARS